MRLGWSVVRSTRDVKYVAAFAPDEFGLMPRERAMNVANNLNTKMMALRQWAYAAVPLPVVYPKTPNELEC